MQDDQFRELRTLILNQAVQISELRLRLKKMEEDARARHEFLAERLTQPKIEIVSPYPELQKLFDTDQN